MMPESVIFPPKFTVIIINWFYSMQTSTIVLGIDFQKISCQVGFCTNLIKKLLRIILTHKSSNHKKHGKPTRGKNVSYKKKLK